MYHSCNNIIKTGRDDSQHALTSALEWASVLVVSTKWGMQSLWGLAIQKMGDTASAVDKIYFGERYDVKAWLVGAYVAISAREEALTEEEGEKLGIKATIQIASLREARMTKALDSDTLESSVRKILGIKKPHFVGTLDSTLHIFGSLWSDQQLSMFQLVCPMLVLSRTEG